MVVISGKGGTGKTSLAACFAALEKRIGPKPPVLVDCDVEAPDLHLLLGGELAASEPFSGPPLAEIDWAKAPDPARVEAACAFGAIRRGVVVPLDCTGCGACALAAGPLAVQMKPRAAGAIEEWKTPYGRLFRAELAPGEPGTGGLVAALRAKGEEAALGLNGALVIVDGAPGIGCPVIGGIAGCDLAVIVTEPGRGALHDLGRLLRLLARFGTAAVAVINRSDLDRELARELERECRERGLEVAGKIPFTTAFVEAAVAGKPAVELADPALGERLEETYRRIRALLAGTGREGA